MVSYRHGSVKSGEGKVRSGGVRVELCDVMYVDRATLNRA